MKPRRVGVLLVNLGTPDGTDYRPMWRYLREFLSDPRVIELPRIVWYPILYGLVLTTRPQKSGANYARIWNREKDESPLRTFTRGQAEKLAAALADLPEVVVEWGMRYGNPSTASAVAAADATQGCDRILTFPLYPQYSATTTATANDQLFRALMKMRDAPAVRTRAALLRRAGLYRRAGALDREAVWPRWTSSRRSCSPPITASRNPIPTRATPITAIAWRRRGCCAKNSAGTRRS